MRSLVWRLGGLALIDALSLQIAVVLWEGISPILSVALLAFTLLVNVVFLNERLYVWRWVLPGVAMMLLMVIYPVAYTVVIAFTNNSDGHLLSKAQVIEQFETTYYTPEDAARFEWTAYVSSEGDTFLFLLNDADGEQWVAVSDEAGLRPVDQMTVGGLAEDGIPQSIEGIARIPVPSRYATLAPCKMSVWKTHPISCVSCR